VAVFIKPHHGLPKNPEDAMKGTVSYLNPQGLHRNPAFSQVVVISGRTRTVYVGGQNAVDIAETIVGKGDIGAQAAQVARNLQVALAAADTRVEHVVKWIERQGEYPDCVPLGWVHLPRSSVLWARNTRATLTAILTTVGLVFYDTRLYQSS
jgi:Endoribonuclease L-PSP